VFLFFFAAIVIRKPVNEHAKLMKSCPSKFKRRHVKIFSHGQLKVKKHLIKGSGTFTASLV
jgi:hypothetical protein